jgi:DNA-binding CsgD family transcriptional regulator
MHQQRLGRTLAIGVAALAVLNTISNLSMPVRDRRPAIAVTMLAAAALAIHAAAYWFGDSIRSRATLAGYLTLQVVLVFLAGLGATLVPVVLVLYAALTIETVVIAGSRWGTMAITLGAIALFGASAALTWDLYQGATVALLLAVIGVLAHAIAALVRRDAPAPATVTTQPAVDIPVRQPVPTAELDFDRRELARLTAREREVLGMHARGARTSEIAQQLEIAERTVKAHLASIYQKLGVESRTAAVAVALQKEPR